MSGPFENIMARDTEERRARAEATRELLASLPSWAPDPIRTMIEIFGPSRVREDIVLTGHLRTLASAPAMAKFWHRVSEPEAIRAVAYTAATIATRGPGAFQLSPDDIDALCDDVVKWTKRLARTLHQASFLATNDLAFESKLRALYEEARARRGQDRRAYGNRDHTTEPKDGQPTHQHRRAFDAEVTKVLNLHGYEDVGKLVWTLSTLLLGEADERATRRNAARGRTDLTQK